MGANFEAHRTMSAEESEDTFVRRSLAKDLLVRVDSVSGEFADAVAIALGNDEFAVPRILTRATQAGPEFHIAREYEHPIHILVSRKFSPKQIAAFMQNLGNGRPASWYVGGPEDRSSQLYELARGYEAK